MAMGESREGTRQKKAKRVGERSECSALPRWKRGGQPLGRQLSQTSIGYEYFAGPQPEVHGSQ